MGNSERGDALHPQRIEMDVTAYLTAAIHLGRFPIEFRKTDLRRRVRVRRREL